MNEMDIIKMMMLERVGLVVQKRGKRNSRRPKKKKMDFILE